MRGDRKGMYEYGAEGKVVMVMADREGRYVEESERGERGRERGDSDGRYEYVGEGE